MNDNGLPSVVGAALLTVLLVAILGLLTGCGSIVKNKDNIKKVGIGASGAKVLDAIKDEITPKKQLIQYPVETCHYNEEKDKISCILIPCDDEKQVCETDYDVTDFAENKVFGTVELSLKQLQSIAEFCVENVDYCAEVIAGYEGDAIVIEGVK